VAICPAILEGSAYVNQEALQDQGAGQEQAQKEGAAVRSRLQRRHMGTEHCFTHERRTRNDGNP
jgi:hypothetical protein